MKKKSIDESDEPAVEQEEVQIEGLSDEAAIEETEHYLKMIAKEMGIDDLQISHKIDGKYVTFPNGK